MKKVVSVIILITICLQAFPCTSFILRENHNYYLCKNFDYSTGRGFIFINQRDDIKIGACIPPEQPSQWISKFGSITFNAYGKDLPMSGMNEKGLIIESLWLDDAEYPNPDERLALPELGWIQYMLDNCSTVEEVIQADKQVRIANTSMAKVHFIILDANGKSAIVEILNGNSDEILTANMQTDLNDLKITGFHSYNMEEGRLHLRSVYEEVPFTKGKLPDEMLEAVLNATNKKPCNN